MPISVRQGGVWKDTDVFVRHNGTWKQAEVWVQQGGVWKLAEAAVTFDPVPGYYSASAYASVSITLTCSVSAQWFYTTSPNVFASISSGSSSTAITFTLDAQYDGNQYYPRERTFDVSATVNGSTESFTINLIAEGDFI